LLEINPEKNFSGAKAALISDRSVLTLQRDNIPSIPFPDMWDLPGGGREDNETPEECVLRELWEEMGLRLSPVDLIYRNHRHGVLEGEAAIWLFGGVLHDFDPAQIRFGNEGQGWELMPIETYLSHPKGIAHLQEGLRGFLNHLEQGEEGVSNGK